MALLRYYRGYQDGYLPFAGALTDQPNNIVECLMEIANVKAVLDKEELDKSGNNDSSSSGFKSVLSEKK